MWGSGHCRMAIVSQEIATIQTLFANDDIWCDKMDVNIKFEPSRHHLRFYRQAWKLTALHKPPSFYFLWFWHIHIPLNKSAHHPPPTHQAFTLYIARDIRCETKKKKYSSEVESVAGCWGDGGANFLYSIISPGLALQNPLGKEILFAVFWTPTCSFVHLFIPYALSASWILQTTDCRNLGEGSGFCTRNSNGWMPLTLLSVDSGEDLHRFSETIIQIVDAVLQTFVFCALPWFLHIWESADLLKVETTEVLKVSVIPLRCL